MLRRVERGLSLSHGLGAAAAEHQVQLRRLRSQAGLCRGHVLDPTLGPHCAQTGLLLADGFLSGCNVVGLGAGLDGRELGLGGGQVGARLQHLDLGRILFQLGQQVAGVDW